MDIGNLLQIATIVVQLICIGLVLNILRKTKDL